MRLIFCAVLSLLLVHVSQSQSMLERKYYILGVHNLQRVKLMLQDVKIKDGSALPGGKYQIEYAFNSKFDQPIRVADLVYGSNKGNAEINLQNNLSHMKDYPFARVHIRVRLGNEQYSSPIFVETIILESEFHTIYDLYTISFVANFEQCNGYSRYDNLRASKINFSNLSLNDGLYTIKANFNGRTSSSDVRVKNGQVQFKLDISRLVALLNSQKTEYVENTVRTLIATKDQSTVHWLQPITVRLYNDEPPESSNCESKSSNLRLLGKEVARFEKPIYVEGEDDLRQAQLILTNVKMQNGSPLQNNKVYNVRYGFDPNPFNFRLVAKLKYENDEGKLFVNLSPSRGDLTRVYLRVINGAQNSELILAETVVQKN
jgi:hypothetical protein